MALRAVPEHPKFADLKMAICQPKGATLGWLESIWHFCGKFTPQGNIGKYPDSAIEAWVEWNGDKGLLISGLIQAGWLDRDEQYRLVVHDWNEYADEIVNTELARKCLRFCNGSLPKTGRLNKAERERFNSAFPDVQVRQKSDSLDSKSDEISHESGLGQKKSATATKPEPAPAPEPENISEAKASSPRRDADGDQADPDELIYREYPRKEGHRAAIKAISAAVDRLRKGENAPKMETREARIFLYRRVQTYARSPAGRRADKTLIPHPSTWFNESRYLDDETNWQLTGERGKENGKQSYDNHTKSGRTLNAATELLRELAGDGAFEVGSSSSGGDDQGKPEGLFGGTDEIRTDRHLSSGSPLVIDATQGR